MKLRRNKKGFTIVELVIVIAVIGVLAAILIPTFVNLTNKANKASDESLVKNLNTALAMQEQEVGDTKNNTMHDAVEDLKEYGYLLPNLVTKASDKLLWNQKTNRFILEDGDKQDYKDIDFWRIQDSIKGDEVYSVYAGVDFKGNGLTEDIVNVKVGFDVGYHDDITVVNYEHLDAAQEAIIRTNDGVLNVNAPLDTVHHYAYLHELDIVAIASASYHEHGTILGSATISQGHIVIEEGSNVSTVEVVDATGSVKVTANDSTFINVDAGSASQTNIVANSEDVYVSGVGAESISGTKADDVELPTVVTNESQLAAAVSSSKAFVQLGADFAVNNTVTLNHNTLIDFAGYTISASEGSTQEEYVNAILNLNNEFEFINKPLFVNNSDVIFTDTKGEGGVQSSNNIIIDNKGELVINGGRFESTLQIHKYYSSRGKTKPTKELTDEQNALRTLINSSILRGVIRNEASGEVTINNIDLQTKSDYGFYSLGKATINGGNFNSVSNSANGGYGYCVTNVGEMTINNAVVNGVHGAIAGNAGKLVINNVYSKCVLFYALYAAGEVNVASCVINNGYFESVQNHAVLVGNSNDGGNGLPADVIFNNGVFKGASGKLAVKVDQTQGGGTYGLGFVTINGGKYSTDVSGASGVKTCVQGSDGLWVVNA